MKQGTKAVGRNAAALKYDIITAVGAWALAQSKHEHRLALRFLTLLTARYNWQRDLLCVGQREIAALWQCNERTVKRDMSKLRALGWVVLKIQGRRGRVAQYGLNLDAILKSTRSTWDHIGPDFVLRLDQPATDNIIPLTPRQDVPAPDISSGQEWSLAAALIHQEDPATFGAWVRALERESRAGGLLCLKAPSRFHAAYVEIHLKARLIAACRIVDDSVTDIAISHD